MAGRAVPLPAIMLATLALGMAASAAAMRIPTPPHRSRGRREARLGRLESRRVRVDGVEMHARVSAGAAPPGRTPVVLVHGLGMSSRYMVPLARRLAPAVPVYAPDLPGFGLSGEPGRALTVRGMAGALAAWMAALGIGRAALVGNSLGCEVLVEFALRHPDRVERLVLQGPTPDPEARSAPLQVALFLVTGLFERWSLGWIALTDYLRAGVWRYARTFRHMGAYRMDEVLPRVGAPALVVWGTRDYLVPRAWAERVACRLPDGRLVVVPGAAHGMNYSHSREFADAILPFLLGRQGEAAPVAAHPGGQESRSAPG